MTEDFDRPERPRHMVMWWARRFSEPLRKTYPEPESSDQFIDLLEEAERRIATRNQPGT